MSIDLTTWRAQLDERQRKQIAFAELYIEQFNHGAIGHNLYALIARLAELLDIAAGIREPPKPPSPAEIVLSFGKHNGKKLGELLALDPGYLDWLAREARDVEVRAAAQALLSPPAPPASAAPGALEPDEPGVDIPF